MYTVTLPTGRCCNTKVHNAGWLVSWSRNASDWPLQWLCTQHSVRTSALTRSNCGQPSKIQLLSFAWHLTSGACTATHPDQMSKQLRQQPEQQLPSRLGCVPEPYLAKPEVNESPERLWFTSDFLDTGITAVSGWVGQIFYLFSFCTIKRKIFLAWVIHCCYSGSLLQ